MIELCDIPILELGPEVRHAVSTPMHQQIASIPCWVALVGTVMASKIIHFETLLSLTGQHGLVPRGPGRLHITQLICFAV